MLSEQVLYSLSFLSTHDQDRAGGMAMGSTLPRTVRKDYRFWNLICWVTRAPTARAGGLWILGSPHEKNQGLEGSLDKSHQGNEPATQVNYQQIKRQNNF